MLIQKVKKYKKVNIIYKTYTD